MIALLMSLTLLGADDGPKNTPDAADDQYEDMVQFERSNPDPPWKCEKTRRRCRTPFIYPPKGKPLRLCTCETCQRWATITLYTYIHSLRILFIDTMRPIEDQTTGDAWRAQKAAQTGKANRWAEYMKWRDNKRRAQRTSAAHAARFPSAPLLPE